MLVYEQHLRYPVCIVQVAHFDESQSRNDRNATFPQICGTCQLVENISRFVHQISPDDIRCRTVHQIPIVDPLGIRQTKVEDVLARLNRCSIELKDEDSETDRTMLVK